MQKDCETSHKPKRGLGLFALQKIVVEPDDEEGVQLFVFGGAMYWQGVWNKICQEPKFPAIRKYALNANKHCRQAVIDERKPAPQYALIDGNPHFGNVAGYINSSQGSPAGVAILELAIAYVRAAISLRGGSHGGRRVDSIGILELAVVYVRAGRVV